MKHTNLIILWDSCLYPLNYNNVYTDKFSKWIVYKYMNGFISWNAQSTYIAIVRVFGGAIRAGWVVLRNQCGFQDSLQYYQNCYQTCFYSKWEKEYMYHLMRKRVSIIWEAKSLDHFCTSFKSTYILLGIYICLVLC